MDAPVEETRSTDEDDDHGDEREEEEEEVWAWSWGAGTDGQLGTGAARDEHLPQPLSLNPLSSSASSSHPLRVSRVACGGAHAVALTGDGRVFTWGRGVHGQLGHGELENCLQPKPVKFFESFTVCSVSAGWNHSGFVTDEGHLFMCGDNSFGQLGTGDNQSYNLPVEVLFFASKHVEQIACGMRHTLALVTGGLVYGFGSARHGQIGNFVSKSQKSCNLPQVIQGFGSCKVVGLVANGDHSAALTANGELYIWGRGFSAASNDLHPHLLHSSLTISQVALGWHHALVLADGEVYMLGGYRHRAVSGSHVVNPVQHQSVPSAPCSIISGVRTSEARTLEKVSCLDGERVVQIAAGAEHSALLTERGKIMTWGWGEHGQLGLGNTDNQTFPQIVNISNWRSFASALSIYCGSGFTIATK